MGRYPQPDVLIFCLIVNKQIIRNFRYTKLCKLQTKIELATLINYVKHYVKQKKKKKEKQKQNLAKI